MFVAERGLRLENMNMGLNSARERYRKSYRKPETGNPRVTVASDQTN